MMTRIGDRPIVRAFCAVIIAGVIITGLFIALPGRVEAADVGTEPKSSRKTCGKCPDGYAVAGVTQAPTICKDGDPTLVECVPLGGNMLSVCGTCPDDYREIGRSSLPSRCGNHEGGTLTQCQLQKLESTMPDPTQGGRTCPPDCGSTATPGQGTLPPPARYLPTPDNPSR